MNRSFKPTTTPALKRNVTFTLNRSIMPTVTLGVAKSNRQTNFGKNELTRLCGRIGKMFQFDVDPNKLVIIEGEFLQALLYNIVQHLSVECGFTWDPSEVEDKLEPKPNSPLDNQFQQLFYLYKKLFELLDHTEGKELLNKCGDFSLIFAPPKLPSSQNLNVYALLDHLCDLKQKQKDMIVLIEKFKVDNHIKIQTVLNQNKSLTKEIAKLEVDKARLERENLELKRLKNESINRKKVLDKMDSEIAQLTREANSLNMEFVDFIRSGKDDSKLTAKLNRQA